MCACEAQPLVCPGERAEHLCALLYLEAVASEPHQLGVFGRYGWRIDDQGVLLVAAVGGNLFHVLFIMDFHSLLLQLMGELSRSAVIARHGELAVHEVACEGTHSDATRADEVDGFYVFQFHISY